MTRRSLTRVAVIAFVLIGMLVALWLLVRDLNDTSDVPEENGTLATFARSLLVTPVSATPKSRGMAPGTTSWLGARTTR